MVRRSMCQCDVLFTFYLVTCLAGLCVVCLVHFILVQTGVYIVHVKRGQVSTLETCQTVPTFDPQPPHWHTGTQRKTCCGQVCGQVESLDLVLSVSALVPGKGLVVLCEDIT